MQVGAVDARFQMSGPQRGAPRLFAARGAWSPATLAEEASRFDIRVNHPLQVGGTSVFLVGQGYAPVFKVVDAGGDVAFEDAVPFLPSDGTYTSTGVVKVPDARPEGLGFQGFFLPDGGLDRPGGGTGIGVPGRGQPARRAVRLPR